MKLKSTDKLIYWCTHCKVPIIKNEKRSFWKCPVCGRYLKYLSSELRPVFPEERLLFEIMTNKKPHQYLKSSVWCNNSNYYIDGVVYKLSSEVWKNTDPKKVKKLLDEHNPDNSYAYFNKHIENFANANRKYFDYIKFEAVSFIRKVVKDYAGIKKYISFSGGKDSTATADLVTKALGDPSILHCYCNTSLEYPYTLEYIKRLRKNHPKMVLKEIKNKEHDFYKVCDDIGVPTRTKRWCCTIFKTGVTSKFFNNFYSSEQVMTFSGLRRSESNARKHYKRIENKSEKRKIQNQIIVSPIIEWKDIDVWLYILSEKIDFNYAYKLGFNRVGCWCCPYVSLRGDALAKIYMPDLADRWYSYLIEYAKKIGKENPENYIKSENWKSFCGGQGLTAAKDIKISTKLCTEDENAKTYSLNKPINDFFYDLFIPFGKVSKNLGRKSINETLVLRNNVPIISIQPKLDNTVKIKTLNVKNHKNLHTKIGYQMLKFNACRKCFKCEGICKFGAITIRNGIYKIDDKKCVKCMSCVNIKFIADGCTMKSYLRTKECKDD